MTERSQEIFGNEMSGKAYLKAMRSKQKYIKRFGDDSNVDYPVSTEDNPHIGPVLGVRNVVLGKGRPVEAVARVDMIEQQEEKQTENGAEKAAESGKRPELNGFDREKGLIVGNIRMGFGHYRISMAIASAAHSMGYTPYWMDLNSYPETTCTKVISAQNDLYSMGSRISQKSKVFNKVVWEPINYEGFRQLSYNAADQKNAELMAPVFRNVPKDIPLVATHVWPAQAAVHADVSHICQHIRQVRFQIQHAADSPFFDQLPDLLYQRAVTIGKCFHQENLMLPAHLKHVLCLRRVHTHRFLTQDVLAGSCCFLYPLAVHGIGKRNIHCLDFRICQQFFIAAISLQRSKLRCHLVRLLDVPAGDRVQCGIVRFQQPWNRPHSGNRGTSKYSPSDLLTHRCCPPFSFCTPFRSSDLVFRDSTKNNIVSYHYTRCCFKNGHDRHYS